MKLIPLFLILLLIPIAYGVSREKKFYPTAGDGHVLESGINIDPKVSWNNVHDSTNGTTASHTATTTKVSTFGDKSAFIFPVTYIFKIGRVFMPIDLSNEPVGVKTETATMLFYVTSEVHADNDGQAYIAVVGETDQTSVNSLSTLDFDNCGSIDNPTEWSNRLNLITLSHPAFNTFTINATGKIGIDNAMGDYYMAGIREGHDIEDQRILDDPLFENQVSMYTVNSIGTIYDPYLEIEDYALPQVV